jgi:hypothetical protein
MEDLRDTRRLRISLQTHAGQQPKAADQDRPEHKEVEQEGKGKATAK